MQCFDVRLVIKDDDHDLDLEVYQRVTGTSEEEHERIIERAKQQFCTWAWRHGPRWSVVGARIPFATVIDCEVLPVEEDQAPPA